MPTRPTAAQVMLAAGIAFLASCTSAGSTDDDRPAPDAAAATDTIRGTVAVVGADPLSEVVVRPRGDEGEVRLTGAPGEEAAALDGVEIWVRGSLAEDREEMEVERLEVRAVDGTVAFDGTLEREGSRWRLVLDDGRHLPLRNVPQALEEREGSRVWLASPLDVAGGTFGRMPENP